MTRLVVVAAAAVGLILFVTFFAARLIRSRSRGLSVRMQVFLALAFIVGGFSFGLGLLVVDRVEARAERLARAAASDESRAVAAILESEMERTGASFAELASEFEKRELGRSGSGMDAMGLELLDLEGRLLFPEGGSSQAFEPGAVYEDALVAEPSEDGSRALGSVRVVKPTIVVEALLEDFAPTVLVISLLLGGVAAFAAARIGRTIAEPIEGLSRYAEDVAAGKRTTLPSRVVGREVARLVASLDQMRRQLEGRPFVETFAADLSHELKNPVAAIRASAEVLEEGALEEPEQAARFVRRIREAATRIERLVDELLSLARLETRGAESLEKLDVGRLVEDAVREMTSGRERIAVTRLGPAVARGDEKWLTRAVTNLLDNALLHSDPDSNVAVFVGPGTEPGSTLVVVESRGTVLRHVRDDLFRRFITTRGDRGGTGLGLSIVRAVAEAHGGRAELVEAGPPKVAFSLWLPPA